MNAIQARIDTLSAQGFIARVRRATVSVSCSQCDALVINGVATHEIGCPNAVHECNGCNELIPIGQRYCVDCAS